MSVILFCNPVLDLVVEVDNSFLDRYGLENGGYTAYVDMKHRGIYRDIQNNPTHLVSPGGAGQNTASIIAAMTKHAFKIISCGCVGGDATTGSFDDAARMMRTYAISRGIQPMYAITNAAETGKCAVCIHKNTRDRSMCTYLGATAYYNIKDLANVWDHVRTANIIHFSGFFAASSAETMLYTNSHLLDVNPTCVFSLSLSAPFIVQTYSKVILACLKRANIVTGDDLEWGECAKQSREQLGASNTIVDIMTQVCKHSENENVLCVSTAGKQPTTAVFKNAQEICSISVPTLPVENEKIIDTNGCGDAFLGGLLKVVLEWVRKNNNQLILTEERVSEMIYAGHHAARLILSKSGFSVCDEDFSCEEHTCVIEHVRDSGGCCYPTRCGCGGIMCVNIPE